MLGLIRPVIAGPAALVLVLGLVPSTPRPTAADEPPSNARSRLDHDLASFRALAPAGRRKLVEELAGAISPYAAATRGNLVVSLAARGSIKPINSASVVCRVKPRNPESTVATTIEWIVEDGSIVKKGDLVARLDDTAFRDRLREAEVRLRQAEAELAQAVENLKLIQQDGEIDVKLAEIEIELVRLELEDAPPGKVKRMLELKLEQAKLKRERAANRLKAQRVQAEAEKQARTAVREDRVRLLRQAQAELENCTLRAPTDGYAVYPPPPDGRHGTGPVIAVGEPVHEGQTILYVNDLSRLAFVVNIHESKVSTVRSEQDVRVRIDAIPGRILDGSVTRVSPVASAEDWKKSDVKVYPVTVAIKDAPRGLKPGMSGGVYIKTGERNDVLQVPRTAIVHDGKDTICFVKEGEGIVERKVVTGVSSETAIEIREGLKEGEMVIANPHGLLFRQ